MSLVGGRHIFPAGDAQPVAQVTDKSIGNHDYSLSDHKWLAVDVS